MRMATAMAASATCLLVGACGGVQEEVAQQPGAATASSPALDSPTTGPRARDTRAPAPSPGAGEDESSPTTAPLGTEAWRIRRPAEGRIEAYTTVSSGTPGTRVGLKVSTSAASYRVTAYRIGAYEGGFGHHRSGGGLPAARRRAAGPPLLPPRGFTRTVVAPWRTSVTVDTDGWKARPLRLPPATTWSGLDSSSRTSSRRPRPQGTPPWSPR